MTHQQFQSRIDACVRLDQDCAAICWTAAAFMGRRSEFDTEMCQLCASVCDTCSYECGKHDHDHCRRCAKAWCLCAEACRELAG
ncbi:MAG: four-helix bundle copper-binding protein [Isosphaera sp.]|nr:four-helix bundle copper-binding protein [Isosphaera sp.]